MRLNEGSKQIIQKWHKINKFGPVLNMKILT